MAGPLASSALLPQAPGVYRFHAADGRTLYIGRATSLRSRVRSYWGELKGRRHLGRMVPQVARIDALECASVHEAAWLERNPLERSLPRWNRAVGGADVPCWLVLDEDPGRPGLRIAYAPQPGGTTRAVLGSDRAVLARSAVLRAWPLHLTGTQLDGAERAFAEARGISPAVHEACLHWTRRVLAGEPTAAEALRERLLDARERASEGLAFETAQRIQLELAAIDWLVQPNRMTDQQPADLSVAGWHDGLLLQLSATDGRLDRWRTRPTSSDQALALAERTPSHWQDLACRNAELAARLRR
ncbi:hypothetical protein [Luteococcus peritonei]|uniref:GIY-YIG domain-containing protein n=1 Tax=Luteococcus peritonei TaxID=88874 RepID=A0ABW4RV87_9ACTN